MPIQTRQQGSQKMYRWGSQGRWYPTREQAEQQQRAAYASGYQGKKKK